MRNDTKNEWITIVLISAIAILILSILFYLVFSKALGQDKLDNKSYVEETGFDIDPEIEELDETKSDGPIIIEVYDSKDSREGYYDLCKNGIIYNPDKFEFELVKNHRNLLVDNSIGSRVYNNDSELVIECIKIADKDNNDSLFQKLVDQWNKGPNYEYEITNNSVSVSQYKGYQIKYRTQDGSRNEIIYIVAASEENLGYAIYLKDPKKNFPENFLQNINLGKELD